jgi:hypothetical protein
MPYLRHRRYFPDDGKVIHPFSEPSQFWRSHLDIFHRLLVRLIESTEASRPVRVEGVIVHEHPVPPHPLVGIQEGIQLVRVTDANEYGTTNAHPFQPRPDAAPIPGVAPAVGSSHVAEEDDDMRRIRGRPAGFYRVVDAHEVPRGVDHHGGADGGGAAGGSHQGRSSGEFRGDVARGPEAVSAADCSEGNRTSGGRCRDEGVGGERRPHRSGKCCDG